MIHALAHVLDWLTTGRVLAIGVSLLGIAWLRVLRGYAHRTGYQAPLRWYMVNVPGEDDRYDLWELSRDYSPATGRPKEPIA